MNESFKTLVEILTPMISALVTAVVAWILRGKWENKKRDIELQRLAMDLRKEELDFRDELMAEVHKLQKQVFILEQTVHQQALEMEGLRRSVEERDEQIKKLQKKIKELKKKNRRFVSFFKDIEKSEDNLFEYTKCELWTDPWFKKMNEYKNEDCPVIDCGACISKQALYEQRKK